MEWRRRNRGSRPTTASGGSGGNSFTVNATTRFAPTTLNTGTGNDTVNVFATGNNTLNIHGQDGSDTVTLGNNALAPGMQALQGTINVDNDDLLTDLVLDDALNTQGTTATLTDNGTTGQMVGLAPAGAVSRPS